MFGTLRKFTVRLDGCAELQDLRFEFADSSAVGNEPFDVCATFLVFPNEFVVESGEQLFFHPVGDFQVHYLSTEVAGFFVVWFGRAMAFFGSGVSDGFGLFRQFGFRLRSGCRAFRYLLFDCSCHTLRGDEVAAFVFVEECVESGDSLPVELAPVDDATFGSRGSAFLKKPGDFLHGECVVLRSFGNLPNGAERFRCFRNVSERFRILRKISERCGRLRNVSEVFRSGLIHVVSMS